MIKVADNEMAMERLVPCGIDLMPRLWSDPALLSRWWGPEGFSTTTHKIDFRTGGEWDYTMHGPDGKDYGNFIRYTKVDESGIEYDHFGTGEDAHASFKAVITFEEVTKSVTRVIFKMVFEDAETKRQICDEYGAAEGLRETTGRLVREGQLIAEVDAACNSLEQAVARMKRAVDRMPADKLNWSPGESARSVIHLVAHSAWSIDWIRSTLGGKPYPGATTADGDRAMREFEMGFTEIEPALALLDKNTKGWLNYARSLTVEDLDRIVDMPFNLGQVSVRDVLLAAAWHTNDHCAQIEYIQTILGDRDWGF
ncbi:MAG: SRPBCC domain-containing protein [Fimbriimonadaceae bacterium]|nr:SRPBCC domain-containing protein [Fimbriimonadaceae bacterium]